MMSTSTVPDAVRALPLFADCAQLTAALLPDGRTNRNYRVDTGDATYFVRLGNPDHGIDRQGEFTAIQILHSADLAPRPIAFYPEQQAIVTEFIDAPTWTLEKVQLPENLALFGRALATLHRLPTGGLTYDIEQVAGRYLDELQGSHLLSRTDFDFLSDIRLQVADLLDDTDAGMCHNDLWYGNVLDDGGVRLIDLEMAGRTDLYFELACFIHFHALDTDQCQILLSAYGSPLSREKLDRMRLAVHLRECLWAFTQLAHGFTGDFYLNCSAGHLEKMRHFQPGTANR